MSFNGFNQRTLGTILDNVGLFLKRLRVLTFDSERCRGLVRVRLGRDVAGVLQLDAVDHQLALLALLHDLDPVGG